MTVGISRGGKILHTDVKHRPSPLPMKLLIINNHKLSKQCNNGVMIYNQPQTPMYYRYMLCMEAHEIYNEHKYHGIQSYSIYGRH